MVIIYFQYMCDTVNRKFHHFTLLFKYTFEYKLRIFAAVKSNFVIFIL